MKITKIEQQKKNTSRFSVFLDGEFSFGADKFTIYSYGLSEGSEITEERLTEIKQGALTEDAKNYAAKLVSARSYTEKAMREKLRSHIGDEETVDNTINFLKEYKLIDDTDYATRYAHDLVHIKKFGPKQVLWKLQEKGIPKEIAQRVASEFDFDNTVSENLKALAVKKLSGNFDIKNIMKVKRYLASRGYDFDDINQAFCQIQNETEE